VTSTLVRADEDLVLLLDEADAELTPSQRRLTAELVALGFRVERSGANPATVDIAALVADTSAFAAIDWTEHVSGATAEVWYVTPSHTLATITFSAAGTETSQLADLALRVAEHLHGAQVEALALPDRPPDAMPELTPTRLWWVGPMAGGGTSGSTQWSGMIGLVGGWTAGSLVLSMDAMFSVTPAEIVVDDDLANLRFMGLRGSVLYRPWPLAAITPSFGVGVGLLGLLAEGESDDGRRAAADWVSTALVFLRGDLDVALADRVGLRLTTTLGQAMPEIPIRFAGRTVATGAGGYADMMLGVRWTWSETHSPTGGAP